RILAELGYRSVALTLDVHHLDLFAPTFPADLDHVQELLTHLGLRVTIETGARFLLDPVRKHQPTLLDPDPKRRGVRRDFLRCSIDIAARLKADSVSFWSGTPVSDEPAGVLMPRLAAECRELAELAAEQDTRLAFEPEPGMFVDTMGRFE